MCNKNLIANHSDRDLQSSAAAGELDTETAHV
jgi:hypothetical protein